MPNRGGLGVVLLCAVLVALLACVTVPAVRAQVLYGSIVGTIEDQTGAVVPRATVGVTNKATGLARETVADESGRYSLGNVQPGVYDIKVVAPGFRALAATSK